MRIREITSRIIIAPGDAKSVEEKKADTKAWAYLRKLLNDDGKYFKLRRRKEPIELNGSCGGRYFLYPSGHVVDLRKEEPVIGHALKSSEMPYPDVLATIAAWIMHDEKRFKENWGCGNIHVRNIREVANDEEREIVGRAMAEMMRRPMHRHRDSVTTIAKIALMIAVVPMTLLFLWPTVMNSLPFVSPSNSTSAATSATNSTLTTFAEMLSNSGTIVNIMVLMAPIMLIGALLNSFRDSY